MARLCRITMNNLHSAVNEPGITTHSEGLQGSTRNGPKTLKQGKPYLIVTNE